MEPWELVAREHIRETLARYNHAGDRGRVEELAEQFLPDGVLEIHGHATLRGRAAIVEHLGAGIRARTAPRSGQPPIVRHHVSSVLIHDLTAERAEAASYFLVLTPNGPDHWGRYRDVLVPSGDRWLFAHRLARVDATMPGSWAPEPAE